MHAIWKLLFVCAVGCALTIGMVTALPCERCITGPLQTVSDTHAEPDCAWAKMHACTKARWQITCPDWIELSVTQSGCTTLPSGLKQGSCTIDYKCQNCFNICIPEY